MAKKQVKDLELEEYVSLDGINSDISVIDGNYYQTTTPSLSNVFNFSGKNSFIQAEEAWSGSGQSYGSACTGAKGFVIIGIIPKANMLVLSGDTSVNQDHLADWFMKGGVCSFSFAESAGTSCLTVNQISIDGSSISVTTIEKLPSALAAYSSYTVEQCLDRYENDDNGLYFPNHPEYGLVVLKNFYGNHAEGGSTKAIGKYTHAEGRQTAADIRYSHAEGSHTFAGGMASHAEGMGVANNPTAAMGRVSHAEGGVTKALGDYSHSEGYYTNAKGNRSHAEGRASQALGDTSHAEGGPQSTELGTSTGNVAIGDSCHVEGGGMNYSGSRCFNVLGVYGLSAMIDNSPGRRHPDHIATPNTMKLDSVEGLSAIVKDKPYYSVRLAGNYDFEGRILSVDTVNMTIICDAIPYNGNPSGNPKFCGNRYDQLWLPGYPNLGTYTLGYGAHAEGYDTMAQQNGAHSEGTGTIAGGKYSHAEGLNTKAGYCAHAEGTGAQALGMYSHASGINVVTGEVTEGGRIQRHDRAYAWSGANNGTYYSHGRGTFNINPTDGINGFYIGNTQIGLGGKEFDLGTGAGVLDALSALIEKLGGKVKPIDSEDL